MLSVIRVAEQGDAPVFRLTENGSAAPPGSVRRLVVIAARLLAENELPGSFATGSREAEIVLTIGTADEAYFYDGILFAALDVLNDPERNPTLFRLSREEG